MSGGKGAKVVPLLRRPCPVCGKAPVTEYRPFCSKRCADVDLGNWLDGGYRIPTNDVPDDFDPEGGSAED
ncbi:MAG: DNA gyrase inhibitor YacG [Rhodospirillales bacterium CG15_BIG_FIL_POST_REV_8_21_14_020_66_15]|nr:MAG: DNA gyrase inhibitor YacG [Rhodospirillales bacterium CG15_BIG_FIL_POST_REV_8_21_14_020_66_15]